VELVVATVVINFFGTLWGRGRAFFDNLPIRYFYTGMVFYFITCFQCALQVTLTFQKLIHFTDWVVGHAHLVMFGVFSHVAVRIMTYLFPRLYGREWYSRKLCEWHYWLSAVGLLCDVPRPDAGRHFPGLLLGVAAALGGIRRWLAAVLACAAWSPGLPCSAACCASFTTCG
jgi:hypothetical protein